MIPKIALTLSIVLLVGCLCVEAQRDGRRRTGRRKPTTEIPPPVEEPENEKSPQKVDAEPEAVAKASSAQPTESETSAPSSEKEPANGNQGGPPFIVPRGTRKPRPHVRNSGESRPRPTLPSFSRKRGPKRERPDFKKNDENSVVSSASTSTTTPKPSRGSTRNRGSNSQDRNVAEKTPQVNEDEVSTEPASPKKRFGGGATRRPSRGNRRFNAAEA
jgi:hypothetical protein